MLIKEIKIGNSTMYNVDTIDDKALLESKGLNIVQLEADETFKLKEIEFNNAIKKHLDSKAQDFRYDNIMSARSYAGYANYFQAEATLLAEWASACWTKAGEIEADVLSGARVMPTVQEVISEMPVYGA